MNNFRNLLTLLALIALFWEGYNLFLAETDRIVTNNASNQKQQATTANKQTVKTLAHGSIQDIDALRRAVARLDSHMQSIDKQLTQFQHVTDSDASKPDSSHNTPVTLSATVSEQDQVIQDQQDQLANEQRLVQMETRFQDENKDPNWAEQTSNRIIESLDSDLLNGTEMLDLECRSTVCRIEVGHNNYDDQENFDLNFGIDLDDHFNKFSLSRTENDDGTTNTILYAYRVINK